MAEAAEALEPQEVSETSEVEAKAKNTGWLPKDQWKGDPDRWRPAEEWIDKSDRLLPLMRRDNERLHKRVGDLETMLRETRDASKELLEFTNKAEQRAYERAKAELNAKAEAAAGNADTAGVRQALHELEALKAEQVKPKVEAPSAHVADPVIQDWISKEEWFNRDRALNAYAVDVYGELERAHPGLSRAEMLAETKKRTVDKFPEKFGINPMRDNAATVGEPRGGNSTTRKRGKTYDDLPPEAKHACDRYVRTQPGFTREKYCEFYDWEG